MSIKEGVGQGTAPKRPGHFSNDPAIYRSAKGPEIDPSADKIE
jgi:hypothetical protein